MDRPENVPEGSQPFQLEDGTILWVGPNHEKLGVLFSNPSGIQRLTVEGRFKDKGTS